MGFYIDQSMARDVFRHQNSSKQRRENSETMKTFMLRGNEKESYADAEYCEPSLRYNEWYELVTPFEGFVVNLKKGGRFVAIRESYNPTVVVRVITKRRFREQFVRFVKSPISRLTDSEVYDHGLRGFDLGVVLFEKGDALQQMLTFLKGKHGKNQHLTERFGNCLSAHARFDFKKGRHIEKETLQGMVRELDSIRWELRIVHKDEKKTQTVIEEQTDRLMDFYQKYAG